MKNTKTIDILISKETSNTFKIIQIIMKKPNITPAKIIKITNISSSSAYRIIDTLKKAKIIHKSEQKKSAGTYGMKCFTKYTVLRFEITKHGIAISLK